MADDTIRHKPHCSENFTEGRMNKLRDGLGKVVLVQDMKAYKGRRGLNLPILNHGAIKGESSTSHPGRFTPRERSPVHTE
jgi:hypothetical protein